MLVPPNDAENIQVVNEVKYLGIVNDKKCFSFAWWLHFEKNTGVIL